MAKFFDESGNEVPGVLTHDEFNTKLTEEKTKIESDFNKKSEESNSKVSALEAELNKVKEDLKTANPKGEDFKNLRDITKKLESDLAAEKSERLKSIDIMRAGKISGLVKKLAGNDVELEKKIKFNLETTLSAVKAETDEELNKKIVDAYKLSSNSNVIDPLNSVINTGSYSPMNNLSNPVEFTQREKDLGSKLGISDKDFEKYSKDPRINK